MEILFSARLSFLTGFANINPSMLSGYIHRQLARATYKLLEDGTYFGAIRGLQGVWADASSLEGCRSELAEVLESWLVVKLRSGEHITGLETPSKKTKLQAYA